MLNNLARRRLQARILIVDDTPHNVALVEETLEDAGYENISTTYSPLEAVAMVQAQRFDLILLDIRMPEIDGFEVMRRIAPVYTDRPLPVLILTAEINEDTRRRALAAGVRDFLTKPLQLWELLLRVENTLDMELLFQDALDTNTVLETKVRDRTEQLHHTQREVIRRLASAGEFRDNDTGQHVTRMSYLSYRLAQLAGLPEDEAQLIFEASPLHDVGKIGIPDAVLLKPGKLEPDEWEIMKTHAEIGATILADSNFPLLQKAHEIAASHHERWDGTGYPRGLRGEDIPISGRIVALADVFDALTSERPYKRAWSVVEAADAIAKGAGSHFDPKLAELFITHLDVMAAIRDQFRDEPAT
jgi:putative two-component system response regulator